MKKTCPFCGQQVLDRLFEDHKRRCEKEAEMPELKMSDVESALFAMESWADGPGSDEEFAEDLPRVKRAIAAFEWVLGLQRQEEKNRPPLRLVGPQKEDDGDK